MEEAVVSPMVGNNGADAVLDNVPSGSIVEEKENINGDGVATMTAIVVNNNNNDDELNVESTKDGHHMAKECSTPISSSPSSRKKRGAFSLFRAVFLSFSRSDSIKKADYATASPKKIKAIATNDDGSNADGNWKTLVDGMRPLRLRGQELEYYPPPPPLGHADVYHDVLLPPPSPARSGFKDVGMTSRYASAQDLQKMDGAEEEGALVAENGHGDVSCPHAIDMQAEEFIAKFYQQFTSESFINGPS